MERINIMSLMGLTIVLGICGVVRGAINCPSGVDHDLEVLPPNAGELCPGDPVPDGTFACCCGATGDASPTPTTAPSADGISNVRWNATCNGESDHVDGIITVNSKKKQDFQTPNTPVANCYFVGYINGADGQIAVYQRYTGTMYVRTCTGAAFYDPAPTSIGAAHPKADCPYLD